MLIDDALLVAELHVPAAGEGHAAHDFRQIKLPLQLGLQFWTESDGTITHVATSFLIGPNGKQMRMYDAMEVAPATVVADIERALAKG